MPSTHPISGDEASTLKSIRAKLSAKDGSPPPSANPADLEKLLAHIRQQLNQNAGASATPSATPSAAVPQLLQIRREIDAALAAHYQVGQLNPRLSGVRNDALQSLKKAMRRSLTWYTRPLHLFQGAVIRSLQGMANELQSIRSDLQRMQRLQRATLDPSGEANDYWDPHFGPPAWNNNLPPTATLSDILYCFRLLFGRNPLQQEWMGHSSLVGTDLSLLVSSYVNSEEFANRRLLHQDLEQWELVELSGFKMYASREDKFIGLTIIETRDYEPEVSQVFRDSLRSGMQVIDIGANIGYFSLLAASLVGSAGRVYSWEPSPANVRALYAGQLVNQFSNIEIIQAAATDSTALLKYFRNLGSGHVAGAEAVSPEDAFQAETVMGFRVDDVVPSTAKIGLIKIDAEGYELKAMKGALATLQRCRPVIITEFCPGNLQRGSGVSGREYLEFLAQLGYQAAVITDAGPAAATTQQVLSQFEQSGSDHLDLLLQPKASRTS